MDQVLVEENFARISGEDMNVILNVFDELALEAEPTASRGSGKSGRTWVLVVHWMGRGAVPADTQAGLPAVLTEIREHFTVVGKLPPASMDLLGPHDRVLMRIGAGT